MSKLLTPQQAATQLKAGKVIAYPTEAVYGLGCNPHNEDAVQQLLTLKQRPIEKGLILIGTHRQDFRDWITDETFDQYPEVERSWAQQDQANTWVMPCMASTPVYLRGQFSSLAVRLCHNPAAQSLCQAFGGAIVSTSANPSGEPESRTADAVAQYFPNIGILTGDTSGFTAPSTIRDATTGQRLRG